jgi:chain length determinant protein EpsF
VSLDLFLSALRARFGVFALALLVTVLTAAVVSFLLPKTYKATTSLLVDVKDEQSLTNALRPLILPQERMNYMQTQIDVITSEKVARRVVRELKLAESPASRAEFADREADGGTIEDWLVENLLRFLTVETSQSSVIQVTFLSGDPRLAAVVANAFAKAYIDTMLELRVEPTRQAAAWFDEQLTSLRANLENAQAKLTDYHRKQGIVLADERLDVEFTRLGELSTQVVRAQEQRLDWATRWRQARDLLEGGGAPEDLPEVLGNPFIQKLKTDLLLGEAKLQELATQYGPNYPQYQRQLTENRSLREKIDAEIKKIVEGIEKSARLSREREAQLRSAMATQREEVLDRKEDRNQLAVLTRDVENAQRTYEVALQRFIVSQVEGRASQGNVTVLSPAVVPYKPFRPKIALNIALSVVVGTLFGMGVVVLMEMLDRRVRSRNDLDGALNVPLLAVFGAQAPMRALLPGRPGGPHRALPSPG